MYSLLMIVEGGRLKCDWSAQLGEIVFDWLIAVIKKAPLPGGNSRTALVWLLLPMLVIPTQLHAQNCDVDFPGTSSQLFSVACGGSPGSLNLGKDIFLDDNDTFTFDSPATINIQGNLTIAAQGDGTIIIPVGVTVVVDGNLQLDAKNGGCESGNTCSFDLIVNGTLQVNGSLQNRLFGLVWEGLGTVQVFEQFENTNDGCMDCGITCPQFPAGTGGCKDSGTGCSGDFCDAVYGGNCIIDILNPVIIDCPSDLVVSTGSGCSASASWTEPKASDNCDIESFTSSHKPGEVFPLGSTTVSYTAIDKHGNSTTCSFVVRVVDSEQPEIKGCPADITVTSPDCDEVSVQWTPPTATDNCQLTNFFGSHTPGDFFPLGTTTVTYTALDQQGAFSTCTFSINVLDNQPPVISNCPGDIVMDATTACSMPVSWTLPTASDNCSLRSFNSTHNPGDNFTIGTTTVSYTATDESGNSTFCSFNVTLEDHQPPVITGCPADTVITETYPGDNSAVVSWTEPTATDNCGINSLTSSHQPGSTFSKGVTTVTYTAIDHAGNLQTCSFNVEVIDNDMSIEADLGVYKAFSPNGDGINDQWNIDKIEQYPENSVLVFDRWGSIIFQADGYNNENVVWDGTGNHGKNPTKGMVPAGTYFYNIRIQGYGSLKGYVELVK